MKVRIEYIDIAKGIGIILMVVGHVIADGSLLKYWIYAFHMPLFFIITGLTINNSAPFVDFLLKRSKQLLIPTIWFTIINYIYSVVSTGMFDFLYTLRWNLPVALWFLPVLFVSSVLLSSVLLVFHRLFVIFILLLFVVLGYYLHIKSVYIPHSLTTIFLATFFVGSGYMTKDIIFSLCANSVFRIYRFVSCVLFLIVPILCFCYNCKHPMDMVNNSFDMFSVIYAFVASIIVLMISKFVESFHAMRKILSWLGKNSLTIMGTHFVFLSFAVDYLQPLIESHIVFKIIQFAIIWIGCICFSIMINHKATFILGRW